MRCCSTTCMVALRQVQLTDKRHKITHQILMPILREVDHLNGASLSGEQRVKIAKATTGCPIFVLNNNHPDRRVRQQAEKAWAAIVDARTHLFDKVSDLIAFGATIR